MQLSTYTDLEKLKEVWKIHTQALENRSTGQHC